jgi:hypothetical protein
MYTLLWSTRTWDTMLVTAMLYPEKSPTQQQMDDLRTFFELTGKHLPCEQCQHHAMEYMKKNPVDVKDRESAVQWVVDFHNAVNTRTGKHTLTVPEAVSELQTRLVGNMKDLSRAQQMRKEDEKTIQALKLSVADLSQQNAKLSSTSSSNVSSPSSTPNTTLLVLNIVTLVLLLTMLSMVGVMLSRQTKPVTKTTART